MIAEAALSLREACESLRGVLLEVPAAVRQADGRHIEPGPNAVAIRLAARDVAAAAEGAAGALETLTEALAELAARTGGGE